MLYLPRAPAQPVSRIELDTERDNYMTADEALAYGLIDEIVQPKR